MALQFTTSYLEDSLTLFRYYKKLAEGAMTQVTDEHLFAALDPEANSIAIVVKHMAGNMRSRWTDFLTSDGEILDVNSALSDLTGFDRDDLIGAKVPYPFWAPEALEEINQYRAALSTGSGPRELETTYRRSDGRAVAQWTAEFDGSLLPPSLENSSFGIYDFHSIVFFRIVGCCQHDPDPFTA